VHRSREQIGVVSEDAMQSFVLGSGGHDRNAIRRILRLAEEPGNKSVSPLIASFAFGNWLPMAIGCRFTDGDITRI
jgi:hypothetical protein